MGNPRGTAYNALGYEHFTVLHKYAFTNDYKDETTGEVIHVDTNRVEGGMGSRQETFQNTKRYIDWKF